MIALLVTVAAVVAAVTVLVLASARFMEWQDWDRQRRIDRIRARDWSNYV